MKQLSQPSTLFRLEMESAHDRPPNGGYREPIDVSKRSDDSLRGIALGTSGDRAWGRTTKPRPAQSIRHPRSQGLVRLRVLCTNIYNRSLILKIYKYM
jgi:hypothetical protein